MSKHKEATVVNQPPTQQPPDPTPAAEQPPIEEKLPETALQAAKEFADAQRAYARLQAQRDDLCGEILHIDGLLGPAQARTNKAREALLKVIERECK